MNKCRISRARVEMGMGDEDEDEGFDIFVIQRSSST